MTDAFDPTPLPGALADLANAGGVPTTKEAPRLWQAFFAQEILACSQHISGTSVRAEHPFDPHLTGYAHAARYVYAKADRKADPAITFDEIRLLHRLTMGPLWRDKKPDIGFAGEGPGNLRQHAMLNFVGMPDSIVPVPVAMIRPALDNWIDTVHQLYVSSQAVVQTIADLHSDFEQIHPFLDGNGRVGRLVNNLLLLRWGFPPIQVPDANRVAYVNAVASHQQGFPNPLYSLFAAALMRSTLYFLQGRLATREAVRT